MVRWKFEMSRSLAGCSPISFFLPGLKHFQFATS
jgi:hypothetical protein